MTFVGVVVKSVLPGGCANNVGCPGWRTGHDCFSSSHVHFGCRLRCWRMYDSTALPQTGREWLSQTQQCLAVVGVAMVRSSMCICGPKQGSARHHFLRLLEIRPQTRRVRSGFLKTPASVLVSGVISFCQVTRSTLYSWREPYRHRDLQGSWWRPLLPCGLVVEKHPAPPPTHAKLQARAVEDHHSY